jgi:hypothetical protein
MLFSEKLMAAVPETSPLISRKPEISPRAG